MGASLESEAAAPQVLDIPRHGKRSTGQSLNSCSAMNLGKPSAAENSADRNIRRSGIAFLQPREHVGRTCGGADLGARGNRVRPAQVQASAGSLRNSIYA